MQKKPELGGKEILAGLGAIVIGLGILVYVVITKDQPTLIVSDIPETGEVSIEEEQAAPEETAMIGTITPKEPILLKGADTFIYTNELLGLSFEFPAELVIEEDIGLDGSVAEGDFFQGSRVAVYLVDENNFNVFTVEAASADYGLGIQEGCCYFFTGQLDMTKTAETLGKDIDNVLDQVFGPTKISVDDRQSLRFGYTTTYVAQALWEGVLTPVDHAERPTVFFHTGYLGEVDLGKAVSYPFADSDEARVELFDDILATVKWL